jgi:CRP-like cAMP-binding protein
MRGLLESTPIFAGLNHEALDLLHTEGSDYAFADGAVIFNEGQSDDSIFLIEHGKVRITKNHGKPDEKELAILVEREFFGETCLLETLPHTATAQALGATTLFSISGQTFYHLYKKFPSQYGILLLNIARDLSRRLRHLDEVYCARQ